MLPKVWPASKMLPAPADPGDFPPAERLHVLTLASGTTEDRGQPDTRWSLDNLAFDILRDAHHRDMSRSTIARILNEADLKPHRSIYWLNSHDPDFDSKAADICQLYLDAPRLFEEGRLVLCSDEKTGMQILERKYPTKPARPGQIEKRVDNLNTHWSLDVCQWTAERSGIPFNAQALQTGVQRRKFLSDPGHKHVFHFTPIHGSWLNQVELFFSVLSRRFLKRGDFAGAATFEQRLDAWLTAYNRDHAHPYRWTFTGEPLVRATPFSQTRRQQQRGRAGFGNRPLWERKLYPPRPYRRKSDTLAANL
jgi:transposase